MNFIPGLLAAQQGGFTLTYIWNQATPEAKVIIVILLILVLVAIVAAVVRRGIRSSRRPSRNGGSHRFPPGHADPTCYGSSDIASHSHSYHDSSHHHGGDGVGDCGGSDGGGGGD